MKKQYLKPVCEEVNIEPTTMLAMSGQGNDTEGNYVFAAKERRGTWGNLWEKE